MYCDKEGVPLQVEHIHAKACGGTDRPGNLGIACGPCNQTKAARDIREFLSNDPTRLARIQAQAKRPLKDAAAVNDTRWALLDSLKATGLAVEASSGGRTKYNRARLDVPKTHALDAACVGAVETVRDWRRPTLAIRATGRGSYKRTRLDKYGFPRGYLMRVKSVEGFQTRRPGARDGPIRQEGWFVQGSRGSKGVGKLQHPERPGRGTGHQLSVLHDGATCRWLRLFVQHG